MKKAKAVKVKVGQVWEDLDPRMKGRLVRVVKTFSGPSRSNRNFNERFAVCEHALAPHGKTTTIAANRMVEGKTWRLTTNADPPTDLTEKGRRLAAANEWKRPTPPMPVGEVPAGTSRRSERDPSAPFTQEELEEIEDRAAAEGDQLTEQLARLLGIVFIQDGKAQAIVDALFNSARGVLTILEGLLPKDSPFWGPKEAAGRFKGFVDGYSSGEVASSLDSCVLVPGGLEVRYRNTWASMAVAAGLAHLLKKPDGTYWNNVTFSMPYLGDVFCVTVEHAGGVTVARQRDGALEKVRDLEISLAGAHAALKADRARIEDLEEQTTALRITSSELEEGLRARMVEVDDFTRRADEDQRLLVERNAACVLAEASFSQADARAKRAEHALHAAWLKEHPECVALGHTDEPGSFCSLCRPWWA